MDISIPFGFAKGVEIICESKLLCKQSIQSVLKSTLRILTFCADQVENDLSHNLREMELTVSGLERLCLRTAACLALNGMKLQGRIEEKNQLKTTTQ